MKDIKKKLTNPKIKKFITPLIIVLIAIFCIFTKYEFLQLPLIGDENYYAKPNVFASLSKWTEISFGHPPGWNLLNGVVYLFFGYSPGIAHWIGLICSTLSLIALFHVSSQIWSVSISLFAITAIFNQTYFLNHNSLNHPIITAAACGFLSLFFLNKKRYQAFSFFSTLAVFLRESSLIFVAAGCLMRRDKKTLASSLFPLILLLITYGWYYLEKNQLMLNTQVRIGLENSQPFITLDYNHFTEFYIDSIFQSLHPIIIGLIPLILIYIVLKFRQIFTPLTLALLTVFIGHSLFFALYADNEIRDTYFSATAMILIICAIMAQTNEFKKYLPFLLLPFSLIFTFNSISKINSPDFELRLFQEEVPLVRNVEKYLHTLPTQKKDIDIVSTNPLSNYLNDSYLGFVKEGNQIRWHGGAPGSTQLGNPDIIIIPLYMDNFAIDDLKKLSKNKSAYKLSKSFPRKDGTNVVDIYIKNELIETNTR